MSWEYMYRCQMGLALVGKDRHLPSLFEIHRQQRWIGHWKLLPSHIFLFSQCSFLPPIHQKNYTVLQTYQSQNHRQVLHITHSNHGHHTEVDKFIRFQCANNFPPSNYRCYFCIRCFDTVAWVAGRASGL